MPVGSKSSVARKYEARSLLVSVRVSALLLVKVEAMLLAVLVALSKFANVWRFRFPSLPIRERTGLVLSGGGIINHHQSRAALRSATLFPFATFSRHMPYVS